MPPARQRQMMQLREDTTTTDRGMEEEIYNSRGRDNILRFKNCHGDSSGVYFSVKALNTFVNTYIKPPVWYKAVYRQSSFGPCPLPRIHECNYHTLGIALKRIFEDDPEEKAKINYTYYYPTSTDWYYDDKHKDYPTSVAGPPSIEPEKIKLSDLKHVYNYWQYGMTEEQIDYTYHNWMQFQTKDPAVTHEDELQLFHSIVYGTRKFETAEMQATYAAYKYINLKEFISAENLSNNPQEQYRRTTQKGERLAQIIQYELAVTWILNKWMVYIPSKKKIAVRTPLQGFNDPLDIGYRKYEWRLIDENSVTSKYKFFAHDPDQLLNLEYEYPYDFIKFESQSKTNKNNGIKLKVTCFLQIDNHK